MGKNSTLGLRRVELIAQSLEESLDITLPLEYGEWNSRVVIRLFAPSPEEGILQG